MAELPSLDSSPTHCIYKQIHFCPTFVGVQQELMQFSDLQVTADSPHQLDGTNLESTAGYIQSSVIWETAI